MDGTGRNFPTACMFSTGTDHPALHLAQNEHLCIFLSCTPFSPEATDSEPDPGSLGHDLRHGGLFFFVLAFGI